MYEANDKQKKLRAFQRSTDESLQQLVNKAYEILGNPVILYDIDSIILAYAEGVVTDDPIWNSHISHGTFAGKVKRVVIDAGYYDVMTMSEKIVFMTSDKFKYDRVMAKIFDKENDLVACLSVVAANKPFEDNDFRMIESIRKKLSVEICKLDYYQNYGKKKIGSVIKDLIDGKVEDKQAITPLVQLIYVGLKNHLYLVAADISQCDPTYARLDHYRDLFRQLQPKFKYSNYENYIVFILSTDAETFFPKRHFTRLHRLFEQENINVGISSRFENLFELPKYYHQAVKALKDGLKGDSGQRIFMYDNATC